MNDQPSSPTPHLEAEAVFAGLSDYQRALSNHMDWLRNWYSAILNWDGAAAPLVDEESCGFAAWFRSKDAALVTGFPGAARLGELHHDVHDTARRITGQAQAGHTVTTSDYESMMALVLAFGTAAQGLEREVWRALATVDPLTGLGNRQTMMTQLVGERDRSIRLNQPCCVGLADVDHFKKINDAFGHANGDRVLRGVAECLRSAVRPYDILYRYGGEEFLVCLPAATLDAGAQVLERMRAAVEALAIPDAAGKPIHVTASFGLALLRHDISVEESVEQADNALYDAKRSGRNRVMIFTG